jgi:hypothetical protein
MCPALVSLCLNEAPLLNPLWVSGPPADLCKLRSSVRLYVFSGATYQPTRFSATVYALANTAMVFRVLAGKHAAENIV